MTGCLDKLTSVEKVILCNFLALGIGGFVSDNFVDFSVVDGDCVIFDFALGIRSDCHKHQGQGDDILFHFSGFIFVLHLRQPSQILQ